MITPGTTEVSGNQHQIEFCASSSSSSLPQRGLSTGRDESGTEGQGGDGWQSSAGGFYTITAHSAQSLACSALSNTSGTLQSKARGAKLMMAPLDAQGEPRKSNQPQNSFMRIFFLAGNGNWEKLCGMGLPEQAASITSSIFPGGRGSC